MSAVVSHAIWAFDSLFDQCADGQKLKRFAVEDEFTRKSIAIEVGARYRAQHVAAPLNRLCALRGKPTFVQCDNGPEFFLRAIKNWAARCGVQIAQTQPGKSWETAALKASTAGSETNA